MTATPTTGVTVLLSGSGTTFAAILHYLQNQPGNFEIRCVVSDNPNAKGLQRAKDAGINTRVVNFAEYSNRHDFDQELLRVVATTRPDLVVLAGFMRIVAPDFVKQFNGCLLNIHPSLLPKYPGLDTYNRALEAGESTHGSSVHFVNELLDGGPLIAQVIVNIELNDSSKSLSARVQEAERKLYPMVIDWFGAGRLKLVNQRVWLNNEPLDSPQRFVTDSESGMLKLCEYDDELSQIQI